MFQNRITSFSCFKKIFLIICCLILIKSLAYADSQNPDGNDWKTLDKDWKIGYVNGFVDGTNGMFLGIYSIGERPDKKLLGYVITGVTLGQLIDGIDSLYLDFKNRSIPLVFAIYVVNKQIKGTSQDDIERILLWLRSGDKWENKDKYLTLKDSKGKVIRIIDFP